MADVGTPFTPLDRRVTLLSLRLLREFPSWDGAAAWKTAERIVELADQMSFLLAVERDIAELPVVC